MGGLDDALNQVANAAGEVAKAAPALGPELEATIAEGTAPAFQALSAIGEAANRMEAEAMQLLSSPDQADQLKGQQLLQQAQELVQQTVELLQNEQEMQLETIQNISEEPDLVEGEATALEEPGAVAADDGVDPAGDAVADA